jgi:transposase
MKQRRSFSPEFRQEAVRLALASDRPLSEVARELKIRPDQLRHWKQQLTRRPGGRRPAARRPSRSSAACGAKWRCSARSGSS